MSRQVCGTAMAMRHRVASVGHNGEALWSHERGRGGSDVKAASSRKLGPGRRVAMESKGGLGAAMVRRCRVASTGHDGEAPWSHECRPQQRGGVESHMQALRGSSLSAKLPRPRSSATTMVVVHGFADPSSSG
jgi:hypothetical protein